jgi:hypothetical protein
MRKTLVALLIVIMSASGATAQDEAPDIRRLQLEKLRKGGTLPPNAYDVLPPPPGRNTPPPGSRFGDLCAYATRASTLNTCVLRRPARMGSDCECQLPNGRYRDGYVTR